MFVCTSDSENIVLNGLYRSKLVLLHIAQRLAEVSAAHNCQPDCTCNLSDTHNKALSLL